LVSFSVSVFAVSLKLKRYWYSDEISALREAALNYFNKPLLPSWHTTIFDAQPVPAGD